MAAIGRLCLPVVDQVPESRQDHPTAEIADQVPIAVHVEF